MDIIGSILFVQKALKSRNDTKYLFRAGTDFLSDTSVPLKPASRCQLIPFTSALDSPIPITTPYATSKYVYAQTRDVCDSLAQRRGITEIQLGSYSGGTSICSTDQVNQYVCCSSGSLPAFSPKPYPNGTCFMYTITPSNYCTTVATTHQTTVTGVDNTFLFAFTYMNVADCSRIIKNNT
jgi:hypothetical protein